MLNQLSKDIHCINVEKGFWGDPEWMDKYVAKIGLIHSEATEILEALRKNHGPEKVTEEFADLFIRSLDLHMVLSDEGLATPDLMKSVLDKIEANRLRPSKHGHQWG